MPQEAANLGLTKDMLTVIMGLSPSTMEKVIREIKNSGDIADVKNNIMRMRIGARAMQYLRNSIKQARKEGTEKHEEPTVDEEDMEKEEVEAMKKKKVEEGKLSFAEYLIKEVMMDVDVEDPSKTQADIRRASRIAKANPDRLDREQLAKAKEEQRLARSSDKPTKGVAGQIAKKKMELTMLQRRMRSMERGMPKDEEGVE